MAGLAQRRDRPLQQQLRRREVERQRHRFGLLQGRQYALDRQRREGRDPFGSQRRAQKPPGRLQDSTPPAPNQRFEPGHPPSGPEDRLEEEGERVQVEILDRVGFGTDHAVRNRAYPTSVSSPVLGVIILAISLAFLYLYLVYVFPIEETI